MSDYIVKIVEQETGRVAATTYVSGDTITEVIDDLREELNAYEAGESDWLEGLAE